MSRINNFLRYALEHEQEEQSKRAAADKLDEDIRLTGPARALADRYAFPLLTLAGRKRDAKLAFCDTVLANLWHRSRRGREVRTSRNTSSLKNHRVKLEALNALVMGDWVMVSGNGYYDRSNGNGRQTRYAPTPKLLRLFEALAEEDAVVQYRPSELIVLKDRHKQPMPTPALDGPTSDYLSEREWMIYLFNFVNGQHELTYRVWDPVEDCFTSRTARTLAGLRAVYSNGDFRQGGRLYGDHQNLRREERATLTIDGASTAELDYASLHPRMLYNIERLPAPADAYGIYPDGNIELRRAVKLAFNALLNAKDDSAALKACNLELADHDKTGRMKPWNEVLAARGLRAELARRDLTFKEILAALRQNHTPICKYFGTGVGLHLQNRDVELVYHVCHHFCRKAVPVLPVHDSFIVQAEYGEELRATMRTAYFERYAYEPAIR